MNVTLIRLKGVVRELSKIGAQLERLADCWEMELAQQGLHMRPPKADTSGPEPSIAYTSEEDGWLMENVERYKREQERKDQEDYDE